MSADPSIEVVRPRGTGGAEEKRVEAVLSGYEEEYGSLEAAAAAFRGQGRGLGTARNIDFKELIRDIYSVYRPEKMPKVPGLLVKYEGRPGGLAEFGALALVACRHGLMAVVDTEMAGVGEGARVAR